MIDKFSEYAGTIVTLIVSMTVIELLLPNNKNKKYVMLVCSLIIMLSVINPILDFFHSDFDISSKVSEIQKEMYQAEYSLSPNYNMEKDIYQTYIERLEDNMKERLKEIGYDVLETKINVDQTTYEPSEIEMRVKYTDGSIQPIVIDVFGSSQSNKIYEADMIKIKEMISQNYGVKKEKIKINES